MSFIKALFHSWWLKPHDLIISQRPHHQIPSHQELGFNIRHLGGSQTFNLQQYYHSQHFYNDILVIPPAVRTPGLLSLTSPNPFNNVIHCSIKNIVFQYNYGIYFITLFSTRLSKTGNSLTGLNHPVFTFQQNGTM